VSRDLLKNGEVKYGDILCVDGYGCRLVFDTMGPKAVRAVDLFVYEKAQEKAVGVRKLKVWVIRPKIER